MFYSQFILAKKGPLGTIWIAAHLERKLRKNQIADTDIGLSVDSIIFPDVPIALRLSSHLLLGVVRIYSKKVNYLFHDCSEALVKIKQAFRSTAVDLRPEESTAPYHSITLPENFDLDNFELPESALLSSNFVDHHVSTREQITLQDTVNGASHPASMFGLDERFGDGDASHIGLELEQELFMDKHFSPLQDSFSIRSKDGVLHGEHSLPSTSLGNGQLSYNEGNYSGIPNELSELLSTNHDREVFSSLEGLRRNEDARHRHSYSIHTPDLNEVFTPGCQMAPSPYIALTPEEVQTPRLIEHVQGPSTPGLLEEVLPSNFQEIPPLSPQERVATPAGSGRPWTSSGSFMEIEYPEARNEPGHTDSPAMDHCPVGTAEGLSSVMFEQKSSSLALTHLDEILTTHDSYLPSGTENFISKSTCNGVNDLSVAADQIEDKREVILPSAVSDETGNLESHINFATFSGAEPVSFNMSTDNANKVDVSGSIEVAKATVHDCTEPSNMSNLGHSEDNVSCISRDTSAIVSGFDLRPCSSNLQQVETLVEISILSRGELFHSMELPIREEAPHMCESSREVQGDDFRSTKFGDSNSEQQQKPEAMSFGVKSGFVEPNELSICGRSEVIQPDRVNYSPISEFLEPEKTIAPTRNVDFSNNIGQQIADRGAAESDGSVDRISTLDSKKHQAIDITPVQQTGSVGKLSGVKRNWRNIVPDDDDLLASILVGRKSQFSKVGMQLSPSTESSHKRLRTMPKVGNLKRRRVLLDDTMFLHADAIRQQLMNTEDIRRTRKKAPCTRPDIWRIQIYEEEDEIFKYSVLNGLTSKLNSLECQRYSPHLKLSPQAKNHNSHAIASEEANPCKTYQFVKESDSKVLEESGLPSRSLDHIGDKVPLLINEVDMEQIHKNGKLFAVKEQFQQSSVCPHMEPLNAGANSMTSEMESVVRGGSTVLGDSILTPLSLDHLEDNDGSAMCVADIIQTHEDVKQLVVKEQIEQMSVMRGGSTVLGDSILNPMSLDHLEDNGGSAMCGADIVQTHEDVKQLVLKEQMERMSVHPQIEFLNQGPNPLMSEMDAVAWSDSDLRRMASYASEDAESYPPLENHVNGTINDSVMSEMEVDLLRTETYIAENAENSLPLEKPYDMEQSQHPEGQDHHQKTSLDALEHVTMETDDCTAVLMESECLKHSEKESNALAMENSRYPQTCLSHRIEIDEASVSARGVTADNESELLKQTIGSDVAGDCCNLKAMGNNGQSIPDTACAEVERMASSSTSTEHVLFTVEGISAVQDHNLEAGHENPIDIATARDSSDFCGAIDDKYADLLNVDDEADLEFAKDDALNPESAKLLESSGWSVRTRGVAKYLKNLFYEESVRGRRTVAVDRLLYGKTRKEASRMFFETLVLKNRDYIQVEQETPFAHVYIKPRIKLVESEF